MAEESNSSTSATPAPVNCWQYSREVYLVGRSVKFRYFTEKEREAIIEFIVAMAGSRPAYVPYINIKAGNPPANEYVEGSTSGSGSESASASASASAAEAERVLNWEKLEKQNDESLGKMVQKIGRSLKIQFCTEEEKELCDALFEATDKRRFQAYNGYVTDESSNSASGSASASASGSASAEASGSGSGSASSTSQP